MAGLWKGTILEEHTETLLAMLLLEDGTITAERRHDCRNGVCYAIGIQGHHICHRGTPLIYADFGQERRFFCSWVGKKSPQVRFEEAYPLFSTDWREQFREYTYRMNACIASGKSEKKCIALWNPKEIGRVAKVEKQRPIVREALKM
jgi:hypothetical protein